MISPSNPQGKAALPWLCSRSPLTFVPLSALIAASSLKDMSAASLGRCVLGGVRACGRLSLSAGKRTASQFPAGSAVRCCVALTAARRREYGSSSSSSGGVPGADCRFATSHEWVRVEGDTATVGISDYAQENLGEVVYVEVPEVGTQVEKGNQLADLESVKAVAHVYTSLSGTVKEVNEELEHSPNLINDEPFGNGWLAKLDVSGTDMESELADLMTLEEYNKHTSEGDV